MTYLVSMGVVGLFTLPVCAEVLPTFSPASCSYRATHIVVAKTDPGGGGRFTVSESWKGGLKAGDALLIPGLGNDAKGVMVLFMARDPDRKTPDPWKPVGIGKDWRVSVVWFDGENVFAVEQPNIPGPAVVSHLRFVNSRKEFRQVVDYYLDTERAFAAARAVEDPAGRAAALAKIVNGRYDRKDQALDELGKCGRPALPALRAYIKGPPDCCLASAVRALAAAGGEVVVPELHAMLDEELAYWKKVGPTLGPNWWLENGDRNEPWKRTSKLWALVEVYAEHPTSGYRASVVAVRDYLRTLPAVDKDRRIGNLSDYCDTVLMKGDRLAGKSSRGG